MQMQNHLGNFSDLFFGEALDQMGQKSQYLAKNANFGQNLALFEPKIPIVTEESKVLVPT